jgi:hypothetical protein
MAPQVIAVQLDQVEGVQKHAAVSAVVPDEIEWGNAIVIAGDSFAIDDAGAGAQTGYRIDNQREAAREIIAGTAIEPHLCASLAGNDAEAVVFDFVQPLAAGRPAAGNISIPEGMSPKSKTARIASCRSSARSRNVDEMKTWYFFCMDAGRAVKGDSPHQPAQGRGGGGRA